MIAEIIQKLRSLALQSPRPRSAGYEADLERRFAALRPNLSPSEIHVLKRNFLGRFSPMLSQLVPVELLRVFQALIEGLTPHTICDPWPSIGLVIAAAQEIANGATAYAFTRNQSEALIGKILAPEANWKLGDPLDELRRLAKPIDLAVGILPFGLNEIRSEILRGHSGNPVSVRTDLAGAILLSSLNRLSPEGIACFVVTPSFFWSARSARKHVGAIGCYMSAVFALPAGTFAPRTQISGHVIVVSRKQTHRLFVAQLSGDDKTNAQIVANFRGGIDTGVIESGKCVPADSFWTIEAVRLQDALLAGQKSFGASPRSLKDLALNIHRRHSRDETDFEDVENAVFIPLVGNSEVVTSKTDRTRKSQNYAQVVIDPNLSDARFVAQFLNSNVGRQIRELQKIGGTIPHLNSDAIKSMSIFVPALETQRRMLDIETQITAEENTLLDLQSSLMSFAETFGAIRGLLTLSRVDSSLCRIVFRAT